VAQTNVIIGVGRSGTKLFQIITSYMLADQKGSLSLFYEPLLWKDYTLQEKNVYGIAVHKSLPLFLKAPFRLSGRQRRFFANLGNLPGVNTVAKFIRMTGRVPLLRECYPKCRLMFIYRDPVGVINSLLNVKFSLLGPPHYESDIQRLKDEALGLELISHDRLKMFESFSWSDEALHWYLMNKKAMLDLRGSDAFVISYREILSRKEDFLKALCMFLELEYREDYLKLFDVPGYNIRFVHELFVRNEGYAVGRGLLGGLFGRPARPMFSGVRQLGGNPIFGFRGTESQKLRKLSLEEERQLTDLCSDVLDGLADLENYRSILRTEMSGSMAR